MISITCDNCDQILEVDDQLAGTKYPCPNCGDINRIPAKPDSVIENKPKPAIESSQIEEPDEHIDKAAAAGYPADSGPEVRVLKVRRCWIRSRIIRFALVSAIGLAGVVGLIWIPIAEKSTWYFALFGPMTAFAVGMLGWWWISRFTAALEITTKRTIMHRGLFSRSTSEVVHDNIRNVTVDQTFLQRVYKVGKLGIASSGQDGIEIQINHLPNPDNLAEIIGLYRPL